MSSTAPAAPVMRLAPDGPQPRHDELELMLERLPLQGARVLELGCGDAELARRLLERVDVALWLGAEVDAVQHARNLQTPAPAALQFADFGAEAIAAEAASFDVVILLKSLHHVPVAAMDAALAEVARVLRPGGLAWISEPVFAGTYNEVMRLFHDEQGVRRAAFEALQRACDAGLLELREELFFDVITHHASFDDFRRAEIEVTHTDHQLSPALLEQVRERFETLGAASDNRFVSPYRVDLLQRPH